MQEGCHRLFVNHDERVRTEWGEGRWNAVKLS